MPDTSHPQISYTILVGTSVHHVSITLYAHDRAEAEALGDEAQRLAQHRGCPVKIVLQGGKVFREVQPTLDWCSGCTPDNCPGGCNRTAPEVVADGR